MEKPRLCQWIVIGGCAQALYKEAQFASEVSREGPAAFYPPRPPFKNLTKVRFFIGGCAQALYKEARAVFILFVPTKSMPKTFPFLFLVGEKEPKRPAGQRP